MTAQTVMVLAAIGLAAGILGGMIGLGGGVILIPALVYFLGMDQHSAQGTSVAVMLPPIGILAAYNYYKAGFIQWHYVLVIAVAFIVGGYFGSSWALKIPDATMKKVFSFVLVAVAVNMYFGK